MRGPKEFATASSSPEPAAATPAPAPAPAPRPPPATVKKVEVPKPKAQGPASIVPPGTKRVLVVGKSVIMTADVENCDAVIVQGNLDGNIKAKYVVIMKGEFFVVVEREGEIARKIERSMESRRVFLFVFFFLLPKSLKKRGGGGGKGWVVCSPCCLAHDVAILSEISFVPPVLSAAPGLLSNLISARRADSCMARGVAVASHIPRFLLPRQKKSKAENVETIPSPGSNIPLLIPWPER